MTLLNVFIVIGVVAIFLIFLRIVLLSKRRNATLDEAIEDLEAKTKKNLDEFKGGFDFPEIPEIPAPEIPEFVASELPDVPTVKLNVDYDNLPLHVKTTIELYDQKVRAFLLEREAIISAQANYIKELDKIKSLHGRPE